MIPSLSSRGHLNTVQTPKQSAQNKYFISSVYQQQLQQQQLLQSRSSLNDISKSFMVSSYASLCISNSLKKVNHRNIFRVKTTELLSPNGQNQKNQTQKLKKKLEENQEILQNLKEQQKLIMSENSIKKPPKRLYVNTSEEKYQLFRKEKQKIDQNEELIENSKKKKQQILLTQKPKNTKQQIKTQISESPSQLQIQLNTEMHQDFLEKIKTYNKFFQCYIVEPATDNIPITNIRIKSTTNKQQQIKNNHHPGGSSPKDILKKYGNSIIFSKQLTKVLNTKNQKNFIKENDENQETNKNEIQRQENIMSDLLEENIKLQEIKDQYTLNPLNSEQVNFVNFIKEGSFEEVKLLINHNPTLIHLKDKIGQTPLHWAAKRGQTDIVHLLVDKGADISTTDLLGRMPKHLVEQSHHILIKTYLAKQEQILNKDISSQTQIESPLPNRKNSSASQTIKFSFIQNNLIN